MENVQHSASLLRWYDHHARVLPWRVAPNSSQHSPPDPYHIWLSEIMLQQTVVKTVIPYFETFLRQWPTLFELAACDQEDVLRCWAGLGYYARARNLHACAQELVQNHSGRFPRDEKALLALPGIGPYTASAMQAIAFDQKATVVDGNVERVIARLFALKKPLRDLKPVLKQKATELTPAQRPGDYAQAMMDLGATVCTPKRPDCPACPLNKNCAAYRQGCAASLPTRAAQKPKPLRQGTAYLVLRQDGAILLRRRPAIGLLAKMLEVPATPWCQKPASNPDRQPHPESQNPGAPIAEKWQLVAGLVTHTFTHFHLQLQVKMAKADQSVKLAPSAQPEHCRWVHRDELANEALPGIMRKIIKHGLDREFCR